MESHNNTASQRVAITSQELQAKFRSKKEIGVFLSVSCKAFLAPIDCISSYFLRDLLSGKKSCKYPLNS